jgi:hypothetical protein
LAWAGVLTAVAGMVRLRERGMKKKATAAVAAEESSGTVVVVDKEIEK